MTRHGAGVFRHVLHVIPEDARKIDFHGLDVRFAVCNFPCVPIEEAQESLDGGAWPPCHPCSTCFPQPTGVAMAECEHLCGADATTTRDDMKVCKGCADAMDRIAAGEEL